MGNAGYVKFLVSTWLSALWGCRRKSWLGWASYQSVSLYSLALGRVKAEVKGAEAAMARRVAMENCIVADVGIFALLLEDMVVRARLT